MTNRFASFLRLCAFVFIMGVALTQTPVPAVQAQTGLPELILNKEIEGGVTTVEVGDVIRYRIRFECSSLTTSCGEMEITDVLQAGVTYLPPPNSSVPGGFSINYNSGTRTVTITKDDNNLLDGSQYDAVIVVQVNYDLRPLPGFIDNQVNGRILPPSQTVWQNSIPADAPQITVDGVTPSWALTKTLFSPSINPTVDTDVTYRIQLCPTTTLGNVALNNITMSDTLPTGAVFVSASNGGTQLGGVVTWNIAGPVTPPNCITRYVTIRYPTPTFSVGEFVINSATAGADYTPSTGICTSPCLSTNTTINHPIDPISAVPSYSKNDAGDPVGFTGTARFILSLNTNGTNYPSNQVTLIDNLPPELEMTSVTSGAWDSAFNFVRSYVEYSTNNGSTWTQFPGQPVSYNTDSTYPAPAANITNVRWRFEYDLDGDGTYTAGLPYTWSFTTNPEIRVRPRAIATTADPPSGAAMPAAVTTPPNNVYTNCLQVGRVDNTGPVLDPCENETMTVQGDYVSLRTSKAETPGASYDNLDDPNITTFTPDSNLLPGDTLRYTITVEVTERSSADLVDPTIQDTLPADLIFVRNGTARIDGTALAVQPIFTESGPNPGANHTLKWEFPGLTVNRLPLGSRLLTVEFYARIPPGQTPGARTNNLYVVTDSIDARCEIGIQVEDSANGDVDGDNDATDPACQTDDPYIVERSAALRGEKWIRSVAAQNSQVVLATTFQPSATCPNGGSIGLGGSANNFTRFPCISQAFPENAFINNQFVPPPPAIDPTLDDFEYNLRIFNDGNVDMLDYVLYDILPYYGDKGSGGTLANSARNSEFRPALRGPIQFISGTGVIATDFTIEYNATTNPCRPEVFNQNPGLLIPSGCNNTWTNDWTTARSYRIRLNAGGAIPPAAANEVRFGVPMYIPADAPIVGAFNNDDPQSREIAWNSFSHVGSYDAGTEIRDLLASEPRKVGITIPEVMSVGNRVWRDSDNSGTINPPDDTDPGIANVVVNLYRDANNDGIPDGAAIASTLTDSGGFYLFSNIPYNSSDAAQNLYIIGIPASNFNAGQPLNTLRSSTGTPSSPTYTNPPESNPDREDHGRDPAIPGQEMLSATFTLQPATEQAGETDLSVNDRDGPAGTRRGVNAERDNNSDLTIDFGFFGGTDVPFSIGNHLWYDSGAGGGTINNGIREGAEPPVAGARVELYRDGNGNGRADPQEYIRFDVTDAGGFYLFDNLDPGTYFVLVAPGNFTNSFDPDGAGPLPAAPGVLQGWYSSQVTGSEDGGVAGNPNIPNMDSDNNGIDTNIPEINGVFSGAIVLTRDPALPEPPGETHLSSDTGTVLGFNPTEDDGTNSRGRYGETDASSNLTIDFGFIPPMSLGNRVWIDEGAGEPTFRAGYNNGIQDGTETGIGGVRVELWRDTNGTPGLQPAIDTFVRFVTTDTQGYYLFDRIQPGNNYHIHIPASNFAAGAPLENYISSYDPNQTTAPADDTEDRDDNGIDNANPAANGITSPLVVMAYGTEPLTPGNETDINNSGTYGPNNVGTFGQADSDSNLTIDFGFVRPPRSIGNRLWFDVGGGAGGVVNDGIRNGTEGSVVNARVSLYRDADANGQPDDLGVIGTFTDDWIAWDTTDANGYYLFDNLPPGNYIVGVDRDNFATGVLFGFTSSTGNVDNASNDVDNRDNGVDRPSPVDAILSPHGILSTRINLTANSITLPAGEIGSGNTTTTLGNNPTAGDGANSRGRYGETDTSSDQTIDFGFAEAYSIGNRVWFDTNNNAIMDAGEVGVDGVQVQVYLAAVTLPTGSALATAVTANGGYYLFDHLPPNNYVVVITADNFTSTGAYNALSGYWSSLTVRNNTNGNVTEPAAPDPDANGPDGLPRTADDDVDLDDNGLRRIAAGAFQNAVLALPVTVGPTGLTEPTNDDDLDTTLPGSQQGQPDGRGNMKVDFGFYRTEIGNLVFEDVNLNGTYNVGTDTPLNNVRVRLYQRNNTTEVPVGPDGILGTADDAANGVVTGPLAGVHPTWGNGEYHFSGLPAGDYIVRVTAGVPAGIISTIDTADLADNNDPDTNTDNNDNGDGEGPVIVTSDITNRLTTNPGSTGAQNNNTVTQSNGTTTDNTVDFGFVNSYSLGNRVWYDTNNNGVLDAGEVGINGVRVELYRDTDGNGFYTPGTDTFVNFTTTAAIGGVNGYYRFDNLFPRDYVVMIPADNFRNVGVGDTVPGDPLRSYWSTSTTINLSGVVSESATNDPDNDQDASNVALTSDENGVTTFSVNSINYIAAAAVTLGSSAEPTTDNDPAANPQAGEAPNNRSNRTVDFGFYHQQIGDLVFVDVTGNGTFDAGDTPLQNAVVQLYSSNGTEINVGPDGVPGTADDAAGGVITGAGGTYQFSGLPQGDYIVRVTPPAGYTSTVDTASLADTTDPDTNTNNNDNGQGTGIGQVTSGVLTMMPGQGTGGSAGAVNNVVTQGTGSTSDPTVDFGFFINSYSLGNRVWYDTNNNGLIDFGTEEGITGVRVQLFNSVGIEIPVGPDGLLGTADDGPGGILTNATGYYRFDNLSAGDYTVRIPNDNFTVGGTTDALVGYWSSGTTTDTSGVPSDSSFNDPDIDVDDSDENGITILSGSSINYVASAVVTLGPGALEPLNETDLSGGQGAADGRANMTVDFGFYTAQLGNLVFVDVNNNGAYDAGDTTLMGATVQLFAGDGVTGINVGLDGILGTADDAAGGVITGVGGTYQFSGLPAGDYIVRVTPPVGYASTVDAANPGDTTNPNNNIDNNDNGVGMAGGVVSSNAVTLTPGSAGPLTNNTVTNATGTTYDPTLDFGFTAPLFSLGNRVWYDTDNSSAINGTEEGVDGVTVQLYAPDAGGNPTGGVLGTATTANGGYYRIDNLAAGDYVVVIPASQFAGGGVLEGYWSSGTTIILAGAVIESAAPDPDNNTESDDNGTLQGSGAVISAAVTLGPSANEPVNDTDADPTNPPGEALDAQSNRTVDFGFYSAQLGNLVFVDVNNNGAYDAGDTTLAGATVLLFAGDGVTEINVGPDGILGTADDAAGGLTTGAGGTYQFSGLPAGDYIVRVSPPAGYVSTVDTAVPADTINPDTNADDNDNGVGITGGAVSSNVVALMAGSVGALTNNTVTDATGMTYDPTLDFGFTAPLFSLGNRVWYDTDNNGAINGAEIGVNNMRIELYRDDGSTTGVYDAGDSFVGFDTTDANGYYRFDNLPAGDYVVLIPANQFGTGGVLDGYWGSGTAISNVGAVIDNTTNDPDSDADDSDENGVTTLSGNNVNYVSSAAVTLGPNAVEPVNDNDPATNPEPGELPNAQSNRTVDFGFYRAQLGNLVFVDVNTNGAYDAGDTPLVGATVQLFTSNGTTEINVGPDGILGTGDDAAGGLTTGAGGAYQFSDLPAGDYIVRVTPSAGYVSTVDTSVPADSTNPNTNADNNDNGVGTAGGAVSSNAVTLTPGSPGALTNNSVTNATGTTYDPTLDFGFVSTFYSLGNRIWLDNGTGVGGVANDGIRNGTEPGINNVTVNLYFDANNDGTPDGGVIATDTTDANGYYRFNNLAADTYIVEVVTPVGYTSTLDAGDPDTDVDDDDDNGVIVSSANIRSNPVTLGPGGAEPIGETNPVTNPEAGEAQDNQSNRTVDFGFVATASLVSLGSTVFSDVNGNGVQDTGELGISGLIVELYRSGQTPGVDIPIATGTTDVNGDYFFGGLAAESYVLYIPAPPVSAPLSSSPGVTDTADNSQDGDDNGIQTASGQPVISPIINLMVDGETTNETYQGGTQDDADDNNGEMTVDFGFVPTASLVADPAISKSGSPSRASVGDTVVFTLTVTNTGSAPAPNVVITDALPDIFDVTAVNVSGAPFGTLVNITPLVGVGPAPYTVVVTLGGDLDVTDVVTISIVTTVNGLGNPPIINTASLTTSALTNLLSNDTSSVTIVIRDPGVSLPATGFAPNLETQLLSQPRELIYTATDIILEIPSLGVKLPIVGIPKKNGAWDVSWLGRQAGWLQGTATPSWKGNSVLTGHVYSSNGLPGPFVNLNTLKYGDKVIIHAYDQKYVFEIRSNAVVAPNDTTAFKHEEYPWLTLITCKEYDEKTNSYRKRVVVRGVLIKVE